MKIVLFGAPGSGKGTQAKLINAEFGIPQISTGDILREHIAKKSELGEKAKVFIDRGQLVPDEIVIGLIEQRISESDCQNGYILDGFPRTYEQAVKLDEIDKIDAVFLMDIANEEVEKRIVNRRICPKCGKIFSIVDRYIDTCEVCGEKLIHREDDTVEIVRKRLDVYTSQSAPLIEYYENKGILYRLSGETPEKSYSEFKDVIERLKSNKFFKEMNKGKNK